MRLTTVPPTSTSPIVDQPSGVGSGVSIERALPSIRATRSSGTATRSSVEPSTNSPGWSMKTPSSPISTSSVSAVEVLLDIDDPCGVVAEHAEQAVDPHIDGRRLDHAVVERLDDDATAGDGLAQAAVRQDHGPHHSDRDVDGIWVALRSAAVSTVMPCTGRRSSPRTARRSWSISSGGPPSATWSSSRRRDWRRHRCRCWSTSDRTARPFASAATSPEATRCGELHPAPRCSSCRESTPTSRRRGMPSKQAHGRVVPTWNYDVVHVHGRLDAHDDPAWTEQIVRDLTALHEHGRVGAVGGRRRTGAVRRRRSCGPSSASRWRSSGSRRSAN